MELIFVLILAAAAILWLMDAARYGKCPHCRGKIENAASVCRHCGRDVAPPPTA